jgi:hypothetical protein
MKYRSGFLRVWLLLSLAAVAYGPLVADARQKGGEPPRSGVPRAECFPIERLPADLRPDAEALIMKMLDGEALYTVVGGLKPMSAGFASYRFPVENPDPAPLEKARRLLSVVRCGEEFSADLLVFAREFGANRMAQAYVVHRPTLAAQVGRYQEFFVPLGVTPNSQPLQAAFAVEYAPAATRHRGYGYLFGYPKYAVDFFVESAEKDAAGGGFVQRDFVQVPVYSGPTGHFVWAVPKGHEETDEDRAIRVKAARILAAYRVRRERYVGEGKPGVVALLRDWFDDGRGACSAGNAEF